MAVIDSMTGVRGPNMLLRCRVLNGMFSNERVVEIKLRDGAQVSFFVPVGAIQSDGMLRVEVANNGLAILPTTRRHAIRVNSDDLVSA